MKFFIVLSSLMALTLAKPSVIYTEPATVYAGQTILAGQQLIANGPLLKQYHAQDSLGQYSYGYEGGPSAKNEVRSLDGVTRGSYSYVDPEGKLQSVAYTADALNGFRVAATNLPEAPKELVAQPLIVPEPVKDTPEVAQARAEHLKILEQGGVAPLLRVALPELKPVTETEEVAMAREQHLKAVEDAKKVKGPVVSQIELKPVEETAEVKLAREEHLKSVENAKLRNTVSESIQLVNPVSAPLTRIAVAQPAPVTGPVFTNFAVKTIRLPEPSFAPIVPASQFVEVKTAESPYAYKWNIEAADYSTRSIVNAGIPTGYAIPHVILDNGRLIRSVKNE